MENNVVDLTKDEPHIISQKSKKSKSTNVAWKSHAELVKHGTSLLNDFQKDILAECLAKKGGGLALPLGSGKTLLAIIIALALTSKEHNSKSDVPGLVIVSKTLIASWEIEIEKFFKDLYYQVIHPSALEDGLSKWKIPDGGVHLVLTTADVVYKCYQEFHIDKQFVDQEFRPNGHGGLGAYINVYTEPVAPYLKHGIGGGLFYSIDWGCIIIDEAQHYTNALTKKCQALASLCTPHRLLLSGTLFDEPKAERVLGYHLLINAKDKPRNLPDTKTLIKSPTFRGLNEHLVYRKENLAFIPPKMNQQIIMHSLTPEEQKIYTMMRGVLSAVKMKADTAKLLRNKNDVKKFNSYKLVMVMYLRQALVCPLIPITNIVIDTADMEAKSELSTIILGELKQLGIGHYLNNTASVKSSRIKEVLKCVQRHKREKVVIFCCFVSCIEVLKYYLLEEKRPIFTMTSSLTMDKRGEIIESFKNSDAGILLMTYELGAVGLNLQFAATVMLVDYWWNAAKEHQAIGRLFRYGQTATQVNVYLFSANTGVEKIIFQKQQAKLKVLEELMVGQKTTTIPKLKLNDIIKMIEMNDNKMLLQQVYGH